LQKKEHPIDNAQYILAVDISRVFAHFISYAPVTQASCISCSSYCVQRRAYYKSFLNLDDFIGVYVCFVPDFRVQYLDSSRDKNSGTKVPAMQGLKV
jgi:hypothetical protein